MKVLTVEHTNIKSLASYELNDYLISLVDRSIATSRKLLPVDYTDNILTLATFDKNNVVEADIIASQIKEAQPDVVFKKILIVVAEYSEFNPLFESIYGPVSVDRSSIDQDAKKDEIVSAAQELFERIKEEALERRASDIHITPHRTGAIVQLRIDGNLHTSKETVDREIKGRLNNVIKYWCGIPQEKDKIPHDSAKSERGTDYRIGTLPTVCGEKITLRIFDGQNKLSDLDNMNIHPDDLEVIKKMLMAPSGMILNTGPTGSGKTSLQYACLGYKGTSKYIITSVEDPPEQQIDGMAQSPVRIVKDEDDSNTMEKALKEMLRQDPDIILVGEIRTQEAGKITIQASQTGHLVFSTLHTKSAIAAVERMATIGINRYEFLSEVIGIIGQRLLPINCPHCRKEVVSPYNALLNEKQLSELPEGKTWESKGCSQCRNTGIIGRKPILEIVRFNDELRDLFSHQVGWVESKEILRRNNFISLWDRGWQLVKDGEVSLEHLCNELNVEE